MRKKIGSEVKQKFFPGVTVAHLASLRMLSASSASRSSFCLQGPSEKIRDQKEGMLVIHNYLSTAAWACCFSCTLSSACFLSNTLRCRRAAALSSNVPVVNKSGIVASNVA